MHRLCLAFAAACVLLIAPAPAGAQTSSWLCEASAVTGTVLGKPVTSVTAGGAGCPTMGANWKLDGATSPVRVGSFVVGTARDGDRVLAAAGLSDLTVRSLPELPITVPLPAIPDSLGAVEVPLLQVGPVGELTLPSEITVDLRPAVQALLPAGPLALPAVDLARIKTAMAYAAGTCASGTPEVGGAAVLDGVRILGTTVPLGRSVAQDVPLLPAQTFDTAKIDLSKVGLPSGLSFDAPVAGDVLRDSLDAVLATLPDLSIPATSANVKVTPGGQARNSVAVSQGAVRVEATVLGSSLVDLSIGRALVDGSKVDCSIDLPPAPDATDLVLGCAKRSLVLTDVIEQPRRVKLVGVADRKLSGRRVSFFFAATGRKVASAIVEPDGSYTAYAPLPRKRLRATNLARYQAVIGKEESLELKLRRWMRIDSITVAGGRVTIAGRVLGRLTKPAQPVVVQRRVSCQKLEKVGWTRPARDGSFRVTVPAPIGQAAAVYRLQTSVLDARNRLFATYTLPLGVNLK